MARMQGNRLSSCRISVVSQCSGSKIVSRFCKRSKCVKSRSENMSEGIRERISRYVNFGARVPMALSNSVYRASLGFSCPKVPRGSQFSGTASFIKPACMKREVPEVTSLTPGALQHIDLRRGIKGGGEHVCWRIVVKAEP